MARVLYAVAAEGIGHSTRSKVVIEELRKQHNIFIVTGRGSFDYLSKYFDNICKLDLPYLIYRNNRISNIGTVFFYLFYSPWYAVSLIRLARLIKKFRHDVIITDFEPFSSYLGIVFRI